MSRSPTGIIPENLMYPAKLFEVMNLLRQVPVHGDDKVDVLIGWARTVGTAVNASQRAAVRNSGLSEDQLNG